MEHFAIAGDALLHVQDHHLQPNDLCKDHGLPKPTPVTITSPDVLTQVYHKLACIACDP